MESDTANSVVYQFHVKLRGISPAIWRRFLLGAHSTIEDLHYTLQLSMGWTDSHLNRFVIHGSEYGVSHPGGPLFQRHASDVRLSDFGLRVRERILYEYDFGDQWRHDVRLERKVALDPRKTYPVCIGGRRACPQEDCGGAWGYLQWEEGESFMDIEENLLEALQDGDIRHIDLEEIGSMVRWLDRNRFDRGQVNQRLAQYARGDDEWSHSFC